MDAFATILSRSLGTSSEVQSRLNMLASSMGHLEAHRRRAGECGVSFTKQPSTTKLVDLTDQLTQTQHGRLFLRNRKPGEKTLGVS